MPTLIKSPPPPPCEGALAQKLFSLPIPASSFLHCPTNFPPPKKEKPKPSKTPNKLKPPNPKETQKNPKVLSKEPQNKTKIHPQPSNRLYPWKWNLILLFKNFHVFIWSVQVSVNSPNSFPLIFKALLRVVQEFGVCTNKIGHEQGQKWLQE